MKSNYEHHLAEQDEALRHDIADKVSRYIESEAQKRRAMQRIADIDKAVMWVMGAAFGALAVYIFK